MSERKRGLLKKVKIRGAYCPECPKVYIPPLQASKVGASPGWYPNMIIARNELEADTRFDPAIKQNRKRKCPDCPFN